VAAFNFLLLGAGLAIIQDWWAEAAIVGAVCSLLAIIPWCNMVVPGARLAAFFDLALLAVLLLKLLVQIAALIASRITNLVPVLQIIWATILPISSVYGKMLFPCPGSWLV
jgi:hypothetical protein